MKKTFLKFVFAVTMGISLFSGSFSNGLAANEPSASIAAASNNIIELSADNDGYTFENAESIAIIDGSSVKVNGNKIIPNKIGESILDVDGEEYTVNVVLPIGYKFVDGLAFEGGAIIDTGYKFVSNDIIFSFEYQGGLGNYCFGSNSNNDTNYFVPYNGQLVTDKLRFGTVNGAYESRTCFKYSCYQNNATLVLGSKNWEGTFTGSIVSNNNVRFGLCSGVYQEDKCKYFNGILYNLYIEDSGNTAVSLVPCFSQNLLKFGFYDIISGLFLTSINNFSLLSTERLIDVSYKYDDNLIVQPNQFSNLFMGYNPDFQHMDGKLIIENGVVLYGTIAGESLTVGSDSLDLTTIFGSMVAGENYELTMVKGDLVDSIKLCAEEEIRDISIITDTTYENLTANKNNIASGTMKVFDGVNSVTLGLNKIKGRGNSFTKNYKNSFNIEIDTSTALISGAGKQKKYSLIAPNSGYDNSHLYNQVGYTLYQQICKNGDAIQYQMYNVYYNGSYLGYYMLTERVRADEKVVNINKAKLDEGSRSAIVNASNATSVEAQLLNNGIKSFKYYTDSVVHKKGGYIIEANFRANNFVTKYNNSWEIKEPDSPSFTQVKEIALFMQEAEDALFSETGLNSKGKHYSEYFDLDSLAREYLVRTFMMDMDFYAASNFLYIDGDDNGLIGKLHACCVWDLDACDMTSASLYSKWHDTDQKGAVNLRNKLMEKGDFVDTLRSINENEFTRLTKAIVDKDNTETPTIYSLANTNIKSTNRDDLRWNWNNAKDMIKRQSYIASRATKWEKLWSDDTNALRGVKVSYDNGTLVASSKGASSYQWYRVAEENNCLGEIIDGATTNTYTPTDDSYYYVVVSGTKITGVSTSTMTSKAEKAHVNVAFNTQGLGADIPSTTALLNGKITKPTNPYEPGYIFSGWYKEAACVNEWNFKIDTVSQDTELFAKWVEGGTLFSGTSISLYDNTWINMYTNLTDDNYSEYKFTYSIRDEIEEHSVASNMIKKVNERWRVSVALLPYQLADNITIKMYDLNNNLICTKVDSVRAYGKRLLDNSTKQAEKDAMQALLNYGATAQLLKGYHVDDLANDFSKLPQA